MPTYEIPGIYHEDASSLREPITAANIATAGFIGVTEYGPEDTATLVQSFTEYLDMFGGYQSDSDMTYAVKNFFDNGGTNVYITRASHFSSAGTPDGAQSTSGALTDRNSVPDDTLTIDAKYKGTYGDAIEYQVALAPIHGSTLDADVQSASTTIGVTSPVNLYVGQPLYISGPLGDPTSLASAIIVANTVKAAFNAHIADATVHNAADGDNTVIAANATDQASLETLLNQIKDFYNYHIDNDNQGAGTDSATYHSTKDTTNVVTSADASDLPTALTLATEIIADFAAHLVNATSHTAADTTNQALVAEYAKVQSFVTTVTDAVVQHTVTLTSALTNVYDSTSTVVSMEFDLSLWYKNSASPVETWESLVMESDVDNYAIAVVNNENTGSKYVVLTDEASASDPGENTPSDVSRTALSGGVSTVNGGDGDGLTISDLLGTEAWENGLYSFDAIDEIGIVCVIPNSRGTSTNDQEFEGAFAHGSAVWADNRKTAVVLLGSDPSLSASTVATNKGTSGYQSRYVIQYFNRIKLLDPIGVDSDTRYVTPLGGIAGRIAYVDDAPNSGPWETPAGAAPYGNIKNALGVEQAISRQALADLNTAGINAVRSFANKGVLIYGGRTTDPGIRWRYIGPTRTFIFVQVSISNSLDYFVFRGNTEDTWDALEIELNDFLNGIWADGGLKGTSPSEAYYIKVGETGGVQTATDTLEGRLVVEVGLAPIRPAEFMIFRWSQITTTEGQVEVL